MTTVAVTPDQCVVMYDVRWETYEQLLADRGESCRPRLTYNRGVLEIMSPGKPHESLEQLAAALILVLVEEWQLDLTPIGHTTFKDASWARGFEADGTFYLANAAVIRAIDDLDPRRDPPPDLLLEIDITSSSLDKLPIYAQFGVPEVWRHDGERAQILVLRGQRYEAADTSAVLSGLSADDLTRLIESSRHQPLPAWLAEVRAWARAARPSGP